MKKIVIILSVIAIIASSCGSKKNHFDYRTLPTEWTELTYIGEESKYIVCSDIGSTLTIKWNEFLYWNSDEYEIIKTYQVGDTIVINVELNGVEVRNFKFLWFDKDKGIAKWFDDDVVLNSGLFVIKEKMSEYSIVKCKEDEDSENLLPKLEIAEEHFQKNTVWNCSDTTTAVFRKFRADTLIMDFNYGPFYIHTGSYKVNELKLLFGYYKPSDKGEMSPYDSETDWGQRLICFNAENQIVFKSHGEEDSWLFRPTFFVSDDKKHIVILCQLGCEYFWGASVFLIEKNNIYSIGFLNVEPYSENEDSIIPITSVTKIKRIKNTLEFTFNVDKLSFDTGGREEHFVTNKKYVYESGKLTMKDITDK